MARPVDPFRTLELRRDATLDDVRTAYRRLAKLYHPDSAGERALPRFLAVQAAYEALTEGPGRLRPAIGGRQRTASPAADRSSTRGRPPGEGAARQPSPGSGPHGTRSGGTSGAGARGPASGPSSDAAGAAGAADRTGRAPGGRGGDTRGRGSAGPRPRRVRRTPGSTSYDGAESEPFEPEWEGASWYGGSSGTYWTINPREFADPRKHGPEYLARGRVGEPTRGRRTRSGTARSGPGRSAEREATLDGPRSAAGTGRPDAGPDRRTGTTADPAGFDAARDAFDGTRPVPGSDTSPLSWDEAGSADGATGVDAPPWSPSRSRVRSDPSVSWLIAVGLLGIALAALGVLALAGSATPGATSVVPAVAFGGIGVLLLVRLLRRDSRPHA